MTKIKAMSLFDFHDSRNKRLYDGRKSRGLYELDLVKDPLSNSSKADLSVLTLSKVQQINHEEDNEERKLGKECSDAERPMTPINDSIRSPPKTLNALCRHVRRRINPRPFWNHISVDDQQSVAAVLLGEVGVIWSGFRKQVGDPFLTAKQNRELQRRITVHIVTVCEQLFLYYCDQVRVLNARGVFSKDANMSRIRGQVATSAGKYLNLLAVRRHILEDIRRREESDPMKLGKLTDPILPKTPKIPRKLSFHNLIETTRSKKRVSSFNLAYEVRDMKKQMPTLDLSEAYSFMPAQQPTDDIMAAQVQADRHLKLLHEEFKKKHTSPRKLRRWASEPLMNTEPLLEAMSDDEETLEDEIPSAFSQNSLKREQTDSRLSSLTRKRTHSVSLSKSSETFAKFTPSTTEITSDPKKDLENLIYAQRKRLSVEDELNDPGIPPLIQSITRRQEQDEKLRRLKQEGIELEARRKMQEEEDREPLPSPKYPQPSIIQTVVPGYANPVNKSKVTIRSASMHVPDHVELPDVNLHMNGPLFNNLTGEISQATIKELDANLFQGDELQEVYNEIMKTVPDEHLLFNNDPLVMKPVDSVNLSKVLASSTLSQTKQKQIINPNLTKARSIPPWAGELQDLWKRNGRPESEGVLSAGRSTHPSGVIPLLSEPPGRTMKSQASWLAWWKATINTDDYFKYLSTKETDFLAVIYHFYDSDTSESEVDVEEKLVELEKERKKEKFMEEVKAKKETYVKGLWNVNVVSMGGLGKFPDQEATEMDSSEENVGDGVEGDVIFSRFYNSRLRMHSRLRFNTPVENSDDEISSRCSSRMPNLSANSAAPLRGDLVDSGVLVADEKMSFSEDATFASQIQFSDDQAPWPRTGMKEEVELIKKAASDRGRRIESDIDTAYSSLQTFVYSKTILSNMRSRHSAEDSYSDSMGSAYAASFTGSRTGTSPRGESTVMQQEMLTSGSLQSRLESVWRKLRMTSTQKLNAAAKYSSDKYIAILGQVVCAWERVTELIQKREKMLHDLELFELEASNPQRFFYKGAKGSSINRLHEAKSRAKYYQYLEKVEKTISTCLHSIHTKYGDIVTLEGRAYHEKMTMDKIEMLYWLQQQRRSLYLNKCGEPEQLKQFMRDNQLTMVNSDRKTNHLPLPITNVTVDQKT